MNKKIKITIIAAILAFLACIAIYVFLPEENKLFLPVIDSLFVIFGLVAGISALLTFRFFGWKSKEGRVWLFLSLGLLGWALGEFFWAYNQLILNIEPFPSVADIFYLIAYLFFLIGLWLEYSIIKEAVQKKHLVKTALIALVFTAVSAYLVLIPIFMAVDYDLLSKIISLAYPLGDLLILFPALIFIFVFKGAKMSKSWLLMALAVTIVAIADSSFAYLDWNELYAGIPFIITDLLWLASYLLFAFAAYYHKLIVKGEV